jgi:hypothetical protein
MLYLNNVMEGRKMNTLNISIISLCTFLIMYKTVVTAIKFVKCRTVVDAVVIDMGIRDEIEKEILFSPVYKFRFNGKEYKVKNKGLTNKDHKRKLYEHFKLRIDPNDPTTVFDMPSQLKSALFFVMFPIMFITAIVIFVNCDAI